ncbi:MAG: transposase [Acetobacteraceae bacterium]|nr:transposase [Acetobacteraceae bacterium]
MTNWPAYEAGLRQRGSLTVWLTDAAVEAWAAAPRTTRGGQPWYSPLAILTALTVRAVFRLAYRPAENLVGSINGLLGLNLRVPDHTILSRRAATLEVPRPQPSVRRGRPRPCTCWWTAPGSNCAGRANGWSRSTAPARAGPGASHTWASMPRPGRSPPPR